MGPGVPAPLRVPSNAAGPPRVKGRPGRRTLGSPRALYYRENVGKFFRQPEFLVATYRNAQMAVALTH